MLRLVESPISVSDRILPRAWGENSGLPRWLMRLTSKLIGADRLRKVYDAIGATATPAEFARRALQLLDVEWQVSELSLARIPAVGRTLFVANHPFGPLDGLIAIAVLGSVRPDLRVLANSELAMLGELAPVIFGVDPFDGNDPTRRNAQSLRRAIRWLEGEHAVLTFPAGEVAHFDLRARCITDPPWSPMTGRLVRLTDAQVVPVHFSGENSGLFQLAGFLAPRLRTLMLPRELHRQRGCRVAVQIGTAIPAKRLARFRDNEAVAVHLRLKTFLAPAHPAPVAGLPAGEARVVEPLPEVMPTDALAIEVAALEPHNLLVQQGEMQVYLARAENIPHLLSEIGRLREMTFRAVGAGTGRARDLDRFDKHHEHLFVWQRARREIVGAYRVARTDEIRARQGKSGLYTSTLFKYREPFLALLGPALELSRPFVRVEYQRSFAPLMLLWKGIGELVGREPRYCRLLGPVSVSDDYADASKQLLIGFLRTHCIDHLLASFVTPRKPFPRSHSPGALATELALLSNVEPLDALIEDIEPDGKSLPILLRQYLKLGGRVLGCNVDAEFGHSIDCLLMVDLRHTKRRALRKYLGEEAIDRFEGAHRRFPQAAKSDPAESPADD